MNIREVSETLKHWADAKDEEDFTAAVLGGSPPEDRVGAINQMINEFFRKNEESLLRANVPALKNILERPKLDPKTIEVLKSKIHQLDQDPLPVMPPVLFKEVVNYLALADFNELAKMNTKNDLALQFNDFEKMVPEMQQEDVERFAEQAKTRDREDTHLKIMIRTFFCHASHKQQEWFWNCGEPLNQNTDAFIKYIFESIKTLSDQCVIIPYHASGDHIALLDPTIVWIRTRRKHKEEGVHKCMVLKHPEN